MDCFGYFDERQRACNHCWVSRQCKSFRTTHGEGIEAALLKATIEEMTEEEVPNSPYTQIVIDQAGAGLSRLAGVSVPAPVRQNRDARRQRVQVPTTPLPHLD